MSDFRFETTLGKEYENRIRLEIRLEFPLTEEQYKTVLRIEQELNNIWFDSLPEEADEDKKEETE